MSNVLVKLTSKERKTINDFKDFNDQKELLTINAAYRCLAETMRFTDTRPQ